MPTATMVADNLSGFAGPGTLYRVDPPMKGTEYVLLYYRPEMFGQPGQLTVILSDQYGAVFGSDVRPQQGSYVTDERGVNHSLALMLAGDYTIVEGVE
ncbi:MULTISPECIES: hypothetical protein [unclassified Rhodococcus (in: high G+C Gram-positive bacteria)]|uniref:hypothetical protein n=1 Tax=unclassified Rhodococcus (in: high G+C Gram-positive bacteria) TaxID=192944 RepID=UPI000A44BD42|nr:hypothetical protein [Rhodococcus sp. M8]